MASHPLELEQSPQVNPIGAPSRDFENIDASPDAFGGSVARSLGTLGQGVEKASQEGFSVLDLQAQMDAKTHAAELHSWQSDQVTDAQEKFLQLRGRAALDALPDFKKQIDQIHQDARAQAGNPYTAQLVDSEGRRLTDITYAGASRHAASQRATWESTTAKDSAASYGDGAILAAVQSPAPKINDDFIVQDRLFKSDQETRNYLSNNGYEGPALEQQVAKNRGVNVERIVKQITSDGSQTGLQRAIDFFHSQYDKIDPATRVSIEHGLRTDSAKFDGQTAADRYMGRGPNTPPGYISRTFQIESGNNPNAPPTGSNRGLGQFSPDLEKRYGINDQNRTDPNAQARAITLENQDNHDALAKVLGHEPTPADYYLAHQQGIGGAVSHLSQPLLPAYKNMASTLEGREKGEGWAKQAIWGNMTPEMKAQFPGGVETVTSGDFARMWAQRFNNQPIQAVGTAPQSITGAGFGGAQSFVSQNKSDVLTKIQNDPYLIDHPQAMQAAIAHVNQIYQTETASYVDQERKLKLQTEQRKAVSDDAENTYLKDLYSAAPKANVQSIVNDNRLTHEAKTRLIAIAGAPGEKDTKTYGPGFESAFQRIHAPATDPNRITDPNQLYNHLGTNGDENQRLTMAGVEKLRQEIDLRKSPEGTAEAEMKKQFLANSKAQITGTNEGLHLRDPKGDELYLKYLAQVLPAYDAGRRAGKTPSQLLNPDSPDYVGKVISGFKRPMTEWFNDTVSAPGQTFDIKTIKTVGDAVNAYRSGKITKAQADQLAINNGWGIKAPRVPLSQ